VGRNKRRVFLTVLVLSAVVLFVSVILLFFALDVPNWKKLDHRKLVGLAQTSYIYDTHGDLITEVRGAENRILTSLDDIPRHTQLAFLAAEDLRFYSHRGIDVFRILGALRSNIKSRSFSEGASTITQQLAKLTHLSAEKTIRRKLEEICIALEIERAYSKDEILEMYMNTVYFGRGAYGIQAAAQAYFGVDAKALNLAQSASLAAIIKAPAAYAPHISPQTNANRKRYILETMHEQGFITAEEYKDALTEEVWVLAQTNQREHYSWYVDGTLSEAESLLDISADQLINSGMRIYTALDPDYQAIADRVFSDPSYFPADAKDGTQVQGAMAVIDVNNGAILAIVGGRDYTTKRGLNRATQMKRQPGSALKPQAVYGPALELGYTTASVLLDEKTSFGGYTPQNAGDRYYGRVTMRTALRNSLNTTAVRLLEEIGMDASVNYLKKMGIETQGSDRNLSLALGSMTYGVTPVQLAAAYAPYANGGTYYKPFCIQKITDADGRTIYENEAAGTKVISEQNAYLMTSMLQSVISNGTGSRLQSANMPIAGKTGTVSMKGGNRDIWMAAYNPSISVSVWMGFDQTDDAHKIANGITGGKNTASLAAAFFKEAYSNQEKPQFTVPDGLVWLTIDQQALITKGAVMLASNTTPDSAKFSEVFTTSNRPYAVSDVWNAPSAPSSFYVAHDSSGYPMLSFKASSRARYRIQRDAVGESVILTEMIGSSGQTLTYSDYTAVPGVLYTYRIIPIHEELLQQGVWLEGKQAVQLAQVSVSGNGFLGSLRNLIPAISIFGQ